MNHFNLGPTSFKYLYINKTFAPFHQLSDKLNNLNIISLDIYKSVALWAKHSHSVQVFDTWTRKEWFHILYLFSESFLSSGFPEIFQNMPFIMHINHLFGLTQFKSMHRLRLLRSLTFLNFIKTNLTCDRCCQVPGKSRSCFDLARFCSTSGKKF